MSNISHKAQKLASAVYLITSFFDEKEPLKLRIRELSMDLVSERVKDKFSIAREIVALLSMAKTIGLVSEANYNILVQELSKFEEETEKYFDTTFLLKAGVENKVPQEPQIKKLVKDKNIEKDLNYMSKSETYSPEPRIYKEPILETQRSKPFKEFGVVSVKKNSRQSIIINLLKRKKEIMIKDVSPLITGCSEKTIQRELLAMVEQGIIKKTGEKRWSRYSLA